MILIILLAVGVVLASANGANDNFKGAATLFGSQTWDFRKTLWLATGCTWCGSLAALVLAQELLKKFSGKGLVEDALTTSPTFAAAVALGAGLTVWIATRVGMPISTTHGLLGALLGAGWAAGSTVMLTTLSSGFVLPLLISPILALGAAALIYPLARRAGQTLGIRADTCLCVGCNVIEMMPAGNAFLVTQRAGELSLLVGDAVTCNRKYGGRLLGFQADVAMNWLHVATAGLLCLARGLNDTPKIAAILLVSPLLSESGALGLVGVMMASGGLLFGRRVAETMSLRITSLTPGQGLAANLVSSVIVIASSCGGMPVSTTHVSCGSLFGIGTVTGEADWRTIGKIVGSWLFTLPCGVAFAALCFTVFGRMAVG